MWISKGKQNEWVFNHWPDGVVANTHINGIELIENQILDVEGALTAGDSTNSFCFSVH